MYDPDRITFKDLGSVAQLIESTKSERFLLCHPEIKWAQTIGKPFSRILLYGPPGTGKTSFVSALANEARVPLHRISALQLFFDDQPLERLRKLYAKAFQNKASVLFIDNLEGIYADPGSEDESGERSKKCIRRFLIDHCGEGNGSVLFIGATNGIDCWDTWPVNFFNLKLIVPLPNESERVQILKVLTAQLPCNIDFKTVATLTGGFVGSELKCIVDRAYWNASYTALTRSDPRIMTVSVSDHARRSIISEAIHDPNCKPMMTLGDFQDALQGFEPFLIKNRILSIAKVKFQDVGGLDYAKRVFKRYFINHRETFNEKSGIKKVNVLLYGPSGCGKTLLVEAVAGEMGVNFIRAENFLYKDRVQKVFSSARALQPCLILFEGISGLEGAAMYDFINELESINTSKGVYVVLEMDRPDFLDKQLLKRGRLDCKIYVPLPTLEERRMIFPIVARKASGVRYEDDALDIVDDLHGLTGLDIVALMEDTVGTLVSESIDRYGPLRPLQRIIKKADLKRILLSVPKYPFMRNEEQMSAWEQFNESLKNEDFYLSLFMLLI